MRLFNKFIKIKPAPKNSQSTVTLRLVIFALAALPFFTRAIVIRHDVPDEKYSAKPSDFPPLATLYSIGVHGTLIDPQWVVTAAHAVFCMNPEQKLKVGTELVSVANRYSHPSYTLGGIHDIALIKLKNPVVSVKPATLFSSKTEKGMITWFIGAGGTGTGIQGETIGYKENKGKLRQAQNKILDTTEADIVFKFEKGAKGLPLEGVSGNGDSGGPAYIRRGDEYILLGISSRADSPDHNVGEYGVTELYTRISSYENWIKQIISAENETTRLALSTQDPFLQPGMNPEDMAEVCASIEAN